LRLQSASTQIIIEPRPGTLVLTERPRMYTPGWMRIFRPVLGPILKLYRRLTQPLLQKKLIRFLHFAGKCHNRDELERLLGEPQYVLEGNSFCEVAPDGEKLTPEVVESYVVCGCRIEIWFRNRQIFRIIGFADFSLWY
jgi:hypothetical protein